MITTVAVLFILFIAACASPDRDKYPVRGVDVSHHQGDIDWPRIRQQGYVFAYIKATEGGDWVDSRYFTNVSQAESAGLMVGSYHYFTFRRSGADQAAHFLNTAFLKSGHLPAVVDLEYVGNSSMRPSQDSLRREIATFIQNVEARTGSKVIIYTTSDFFRDYLMNQFTDNPIWFRDILWGEPSLPDGRRWLFWQYRVGALDGVSTSIDQNTFSGTLGNLQALRISDANPRRDTSSR